MHVTKWTDVGLDGALDDVAFMTNLQIQPVVATASRRVAASPMRRRPRRARQRSRSRPCVASSSVSFSLGRSPTRSIDRWRCQQQGLACLRAEAPWQQECSCSPLERGVLRPLGLQQCQCMSGNHQFFIGWYDVNGDAAILSRYEWLRLGVRTGV